MTVDKRSVTAVCIDDFALQKRYSYGTVMVDLESHRIIDMIPSRDSNDVAKWLKTYPNIKIVSRDGAQIYSSAVNKSHPDATQVSDRFHLIKGLTEAVQKYIIREYPVRLEIPVTKLLSSEMKVLLNVNNRGQRIRYAQDKHREGMTVFEIAHCLRTSKKTIEKYLAIPEEEIPAQKYTVKELEYIKSVKQKQDEVDEARRLYKDGNTLEGIAKIMHHNPDTIKRYIDPGFNVVDPHFDMRLPGKLTPYRDEVIELRKKGYNINIQSYVVCLIWLLILRK